MYTVVYSHCLNLQYCLYTVHCTASTSMYTVQSVPKYSIVMYTGYFTSCSVHNTLCTQYSQCLNIQQCMYPIHPQTDYPQILSYGSILSLDSIFLQISRQSQVPKLVFNNVCTFYSRRLNVQKCMYTYTNHTISHKYSYI